MAFTAVTTIVDNRPNPHFPVWETQTVFTIAAGDGSAELTEEVRINGRLMDLSIVVGAATGIVGTVDIDFDDRQDVEFDANAGLAEGSTTIPSSIDILVNNFKIRCNPSDDPTSGSWVVTVLAKGL
jgi:hypothetical protein